MFKKRAKELLLLFSLLKQLKHKQRVGVIKYLDEKSTESLYEAIHNVLHNKNVSPQRRNRLKRILRPHKNLLRYLGNKKRSKKIKQQKLAEIGGSPLALILSTAIPILTEVLINKLKSE